MLFLLFFYCAFHTQGSNSIIYKEALIDLARTLEEARQFINTFAKTKSTLRRLQNVCYVNRVKVS